MDICMRNQLKLLYIFTHTTRDTDICRLAQELRIDIEPEEERVYRERKNKKMICPS